jgi:hypothetical protein
LGFDAEQSPIVIPINTGTNRAGKPIPLPAEPNSMQMNHSGSKLYLGSFSGLMELDTATRAAKLLSLAAPGLILTISPDDTKIVVSPYFSQPVSTNIYDVRSTSVTSLPVLSSGAVFSQDDTKVYLTGANTIIEYTLATGAQQVITVEDPHGPLGVALPRSGNFFYVSTAGGTIEVHAACDNSLVETIPAPANFQLTPLGDGKLLGWHDGTVDAINVAQSANGCPPAATHSVQSTPLHMPAAGNTGMVVAPDSAKAYLAAQPDLQPVYGYTVYDVATHKATNRLLSGESGSLSVAVSADSRIVYVGGIGLVSGRRGVHVVEADSGQEQKFIPLSFAPHLLAMGRN